MIAQKEVNRINSRYEGVITSSKLSANTKRIAKSNFLATIKKFDVATPRGDRLSATKLNALSETKQNILMKELRNYNKEESYVKALVRRDNKTNETLFNQINRRLSRKEAQEFWKEFEEIEDMFGEQYSTGGAETFAVLSNAKYVDKLSAEERMQLFSEMVERGESLTIMNYANGVKKYL